MMLRPALAVLVSIYLTAIGPVLAAEGENTLSWEDIKDALWLTGYVDVRAGWRLQEDRVEKDRSLGELRLQVEGEREIGPAMLKIGGDFLYDSVPDTRHVDLDEGRGWFDLRSASLSFTPLEFMDVKLGRQVLTWGTGDLVFINDLFPKDWNSFFCGRDTEYLKAPSDALKVSVFGDALNLDVVVTPRFDSDRYIDGSRISYWHGGLARRAGRDVDMVVDERDEWFDDAEIALRAFRNIGGYEAAVYGYSGFWKSPVGSTGASAFFPELDVYGASVRGPVGNGIGSIEIGYYDSRDDTAGTDAGIPNSEARLLVSYEREIARDLTAGLQYYVEWMLDYEEYLNSIGGQPEADEDRHVLTLRLTKMMLRQNLRLSLFTYYSSSDEDAYVRANAHYKVTDSWSVECGANVFCGDEDHTFFGQFEDNSNVYAGARYSF